jgi:hypothetical protein
MLTTVTIEIIAFWDVTPCSLIDVIDATEEHASFVFRDADFFSNDYGDNVCFRNICKHIQEYTASYLRSD